MRQLVAILVICVIAVLSFKQLIEHTRASADAIQQRYCENVEIYNLTSGRNGWPDYKGDAAQKCPATPQPQ